MRSKRQRGIRSILREEGALLADSLFTALLLGTGTSGGTPGGAPWGTTTFNQWNNSSLLGFVKQNFVCRHMPLLLPLLRYQLSELFLHSDPPLKQELTAQALAPPF
jgi:hypothetical protein